MNKLDVKCDQELENIINNAINDISAELRTISLDVNIYIYIISIALTHSTNSFMNTWKLA